MHLDSSHGQSVPDPEEHDVVSALETLTQPDAYVILGRADEDYVQAQENKLEYRRNERHFRAPEETSDASTINRAFVSYLRNDPEFTSLVGWTDVTEDIDLGPARSTSSGERSSPGAFLIIGSLVVLFGLLTFIWLGTTRGWFTD